MTRCRASVLTLVLEIQGRSTETLGRPFRGFAQRRATSAECKCNVDGKLVALQVWCTFKKTPIDDKSQNDVRLILERGGGDQSDDEGGMTEISLVDRIMKWRDQARMNFRVQSAAFLDQARKNDIVKCVAGENVKTLSLALFQA